MTRKTPKADYYTEDGEYIHIPNLVVVSESNEPKYTGLLAPNGAHVLKVPPPRNQIGFLADHINADPERDYVYEIDPSGPEEDDNEFDDD